MRARPRRRYLPPDTGERMVSAIASNVLDRQFHVLEPNTKWIADFTYIWTAESWLYMAAVIDLFSRRVVGWSMSASMTAQRVTDALLMAICGAASSKPCCIIPIREANIQSEPFRLLLADNGVSCSMSRSGNVWERAIGGAIGSSPMASAAMESFFSWLKTERTARKTYRTRAQAKADVLDYIKCF